MSDAPRLRTNADLLLPYALPYLAYVGVATLAAPLGRELDYVLRIAACGAALLWARRSWVPFTGPRSAAGSLAWGAAAGLLGTVLWVLLLFPLAGATAAEWSGTAFALRLLASATLVPIFEELLMRGYLLRVLVQWDEARRSGSAQPLADAMGARSIAEVAPGAWTPLAVAGSSLLFAAGHRPEEWPAALAYGLLMCALWIVRRDLLSCVFAHAVTNATLALWVLASGLWQLW
jgi:membrane protease YdiL (CAAX protease family)